MVVDDEPFAVANASNGLPDISAIIGPCTLAKDASELLRAQILPGNLRRGTHLVEAELAASFGMTRGMVRVRV